jgi:two-component system, NarL family, nitrate/nitrite response regulator NarL
MVRSRWSHALQRICTIHEESHRDALVGALLKLKPEVLLLDCSVPNLRRAEDIATIHQASPGTAVLLLAQAPDDHQALCALKASVRGYDDVRISPTLLRRAIEKIQCGEIWARRGVLSRLVTELALLVRRQRLAATSASFGVLTPREREIAGMVMEGAINKEIAARLNVREGTVKASLARIFRKLGCSSRVQLALAVAAGDSTRGRGGTRSLTTVAH